MERWRREKNLPQEAVAEVFDATSITIGRHERREVKPSIDAAVNIAYIQKVSVDCLVDHFNKFVKSMFY